MPESSLQSSREHHEYAKEKGAIKLAVITVSDSRTAETDTNGDFLKTAIAEAGHELAAYHLIKDDPEEVRRVLREESQGQVDILLFNGGTGISKRDNTYDVINAHLEKHLPGFGELFSMLSYEQVGAAAMLSRAIAGTFQGKVIIATPGSPAAVRLAWEKLTAPEIQHLAWELGR